jgi:Sulfotransferase family
LLKLAQANCSAELIRERSGYGDLSDRPVFIVGMPRSGTTLVEQILASHPEACAVGERADFTHALSEFLRAHPDLASSLGSLTQMHFRWLGAEYLRRISEAPGARERARKIVNKYPFNFAAMGVIHMALPNARFIHVRRSPVDTCLSCYSHLFKDIAFSYDLGELGRYYRAYHALMAHWRAALPTGVLVEVDYEALVTDFEPHARRLLDHCGLEWNDACTDFYLTPRHVVTASAAQVRKPLFQTSLKRWRPDRTHIAPLLDALGPLAD